MKSAENKYFLEEPEDAGEGLSEAHTLLDYAIRNWKCSDPEVLAKWLMDAGQLIDEAIIYLEGKCGRRYPKQS